MLCTFFCQKLTTALLESAEGREWLYKIFHYQSPRKECCWPSGGQTRNHLITSRRRILLSHLVAYDVCLIGKSMPVLTDLKGRPTFRLREFIDSRVRRRDLLMAVWSMCVFVKRVELFHLNTGKYSVVHAKHWRLNQKIFGLGKFSRLHSDVRFSKLYGLRSLISSKT